MNWSFLKSFWFKVLVVLVAGLAVYYFTAWLGFWQDSLGLLLFREGRIEEVIFLILVVFLIGTVLKKLLDWVVKEESR